MQNTLAEHLEKYAEWKYNGKYKTEEEENAKVHCLRTGDAPFLFPIPKDRGMTVAWQVFWRCSTVR